LRTCANSYAIGPPWGRFQREASSRRASLKGLTRSDDRHWEGLSAPMPPPAPTNEPVASTTDSSPGFWPIVRQAGSVLGSHAAAALIGIVSLPLLARTLGPESYGRLSLFLTLLGVVTYQDFLRPLLVRALAIADAVEKELRALSTCVAWSLGIGAACVAAFIFTPIVAALFAIAVLAHGLASIGWARLSLAGRVARAALIRNVAWAAAAGTSAWIASAVPDVGLALVVAPFCAANVVTLFAYALHTNVRTKKAISNTLFSSAIRAWNAHRSAIGGLIGFGLANALVISADRLIAERYLDAHDFGLYSGCADLASKLALVGTALGTVLYPSFARRAGAGADEARRFVSISTRVMLGWAVVIALLVAFSGAIVTLVLGPEFASGAWICAALFAASFVHMTGFLLTPWQRSRGEFVAQTRAYAIAGVAMIAVGVALVPVLGIAGAVLCACTARVAEILLIVGELPRFPRGILRGRTVAAFALMAVGIAAFAASRAAGDI